MDMLAEAQSGSSWHWWKLGAFVGMKRSARIPDLRRFYTTDVAARGVDKVWYQNHQPEFVHGRGEWPRHETAQFAAFRHTQLARQLMHDAAPRWLAKTCSGFFAANHELQPLIDLMLFNTRCF